MILQTTIAPQPVFCATAHAHRDIAVAREVCAGRFTLLGQTLDLGVEPNWYSPQLPLDEEWRIEWSKFPYSLDMAFAFDATGDARFLRAWEQLVRSWIAQVPPDADPSDVIGRRVLNWIYAWSAFAEAPAFVALSDGIAERILRSLYEQVWHLRGHLTPQRNHRTLELYALFVAALALPQLDDGGALREIAMSELHQNLLTDIYPDGVQRECSTHYHMIALRSFVAARENARRFGLRFPASYDERLERACEFAMHCHRPDGAIPALSDSDTGSYADMLELAAELLARPDFRYAASAGAHGRPPAQRNASFPLGGYFTQRSGWGAGTTRFDQERFLIFDCGPLGDGGHGHYDLLSVEIAAGGRPLVVDPGRYTYAEHAPNWRRWFKSTAAHNTVCVDGLDQTPYRRGKPKGSVAHGRLLARHSAPGLDILCGMAISPAYTARHTRWVLFVADEYWIIVDQLRGERPHRYDLRFHLAPEAQGRTLLEARADATVVRAPGLALALVASRAPQIEPGWVAPSYGNRQPAPVISVTAEGASADFVTFVVPLAADEPTPTLRVDAGFAPAMRVEVSGVGPDGAARDRVIWSDITTSIDLGPFHGRAQAAWLREAADGTALGLRAVGPLDLGRADGGECRPLAHLDEPGWISWDAAYGLRQGDRSEL
jgi:hypothetical protein